MKFKLTSLGKNSPLKTTPTTYQKWQHSTSLQISPKPRLQDGAPFRHGFCIARHLWLLAESLLHCEGWCHGDSFAVNMTSDCQGLLRTTSNQSSNSYFRGWVDDKSPNNHQLLPSLTAKVRWQCDPTNWTFVQGKTLIWPWFCEIIRWDSPFSRTSTRSTKVR